MASYLRQRGITYPGYTINGVRDTDIHVGFEHVSPTDGRYYYKLKYWYYDITAGETTSPDYWHSDNSANSPYPFLIEASGAHSTSEEHEFIISLGLNVNHQYAFNSELWYSTDLGNTWAASSLRSGRYTFTVDDQSAPPTSGSISNVQKKVTDTGVTIQWNFVPDASTTDYYRGHVTLGTSNQDTSSVASKYSSMSQGNSGTITFVVQFSGLTPGTYYAFQISMESGSSAQTMSSIGVAHVGNFSTTSSRPTLLQWQWNHASGSWNISNANASSAQTSAAQNAVTNRTATTNFHHLVWNDLADWLTDCMVALGVSYSSADVLGAKMTASPYVLTAVRWNALKNLFNTLLDSGLSGSGSDLHMATVQSGQTVYGSTFINLVNAMNNYIDEYNNGERG